MSHIHIPDGVLPPIVWIGGYLLTLIILFLLSKKLDGEDAKRKVPFAGITAAIMLISMSIPLGFIPLHFSLAVLCGILLGPSLGFIVAFVVNIVLAFFGHGGITVVGLNTLIMGTEVMVGFYLFKLISGRLKLISSVAISTVAALLISISLMVAVVGNTVGIAEALPHNHHSHEHIHVEYVPDMTNEQQSLLNNTGWGAIFIILLIGIALETTVTTLLVKYFASVRPDLIGIEEG